MLDVRQDRQVLWQVQLVAKIELNMANPRHLHEAEQRAQLWIVRFNSWGWSEVRHVNRIVELEERQRKRVELRSENGE